MERNRNSKKPEEKPIRRKRVNIDRDTEIEIVNNSPSDRFVCTNPRMQTSIDMERHGDREYITISDMRVLLNTHRSFVESFQIIITEVLGEYDIEDVIQFLGLDKVYEEGKLLLEYEEDIFDENTVKTFILESDSKEFEEIIEKVNPRFRYTIIKTAIVLFKLGEFGDYTKMRAMKKYISDDTFDDAEDSELDNSVNII